MDLWERGGGESWEEWREQKLWLRYIVWEKNLLLIKIKKSKTIKMLIIYFKREFEKKYPARVEFAAMDDKGN